MQERLLRRGFSRRPESIKGSFDGTLPRMSALCGVYSRITIVKYGVAGVGREGAVQGDKGEGESIGQCLRLPHTRLLDGRTV